MAELGIRHLSQIDAGTVYCDAGVCEMSARALAAWSSMRQVPQPHALYAGPPPTPTAASCILTLTKLCSARR